MKNLLKVLLRENILTEIDWNEKYGDVSKKPMSLDQTKEYLAKVVGNCQLPPNKREKLSPDKPYIHAKKNSENRRW